MSTAIPLTQKKQVGIIREDISTTFAKQRGESVTAVGGVFNVLENFRWTLSKHQNRKDVPYIWLKEFNANETAIQKQINYYAQLLPEKALAAAGVASSNEPLDIYKEIFPHTDRDNCYQYVLPYFAKNNLELSTPNWTQIEPAAEAIGGFAESMSKTWLKESTAKFVEGANAVLGGVNTAANIMAAAQYPIVGALDRPRIFSQHSERTITISFPLFNTVDPNEWKANQKFVHTLMNQNLMYKTSYVTGVPPVFYDVFIPGQYYCWASCVTNLNVENLGNTRIIDSTIVPDAYQVTLTLTEMVQPSKNQFDARFTGETSSGKVNVSLRGAGNEAALNALESVVNRFTERPQNFNSIQ